MKKNLTDKAPRHEPGDDMLPEYSFDGGVRGKYASQYAEGSNVVVLAPDVAAVFPNSESVNEALRTLVRLTRRADVKIQR
jgi:hypothetical protein